MGTVIVETKDARLTVAYYICRKACCAAC